MIFKDLSNWAFASNDKKIKMRKANWGLNRILAMLLSIRIGNMYFSVLQINASEKPFSPLKLRLNALTLVKFGVFVIWWHFCDYSGALKCNNRTSIYSHNFISI
jgi:hypothetical protein